MNATSSESEDDTFSASDERYCVPLNCITCVLEACDVVNLNAQLILTEMTVTSMESWNLMKLLYKVCMYITKSFLLLSMNILGTENTRVICNLDKLLELATGKCQEPDCAQTCPVTRYKIYGCCIVIQGQYSRGHKFVWASSEMLMNRSKNKLFKNNLLFSSAVVLSGLSYYKVSDFAKIIRLSVSSSTSFHSYQRHYICPGIQVFFDKEQVVKASLITTCIHKMLCVCLSYRTKFFLHTKITV